VYTRTEVVGLQANSVKPGRAPTGMATQRMITIDQADRLVLDFYRCAMLPASPDWRPDDRPGDDLSTIGADAAPPAPIRRRNGTARFSETRCPVRTLTPVWRVRSCAAPATLSASHLNWLDSP
jgi:hypothetical protein